MSNDPARKLLLAIESGDLSSVQTLVENDPALASTIVDDGDPLGWAAFYAHPHIVKYLIGRDVDVNWRTARDTTPLAFALRGAEGAFISHGVNRPSENYRECAELIRAAGGAE